MTDLARFRITVAADGSQPDALDASEAILLEIAGEIDIGSSPDLHDQLEALLPLRKPIILDMARVEFVDASGIGVLLEIASRATAAGSGIVLRRPSRPVVYVMELLELDGLLPVEQDNATLK